MSTTHAVSFAGRRSHNEDAVLVARSSDDTNFACLLAVADGMGGSAAGEIASRIAVETLRSAWTTFASEGDVQSDRAVRTFLRQTVHEINDRIAEESKTGSGHEGMGTTLTAAVVADAGVIWANIGDSRGYLITRDHIEQITDDHSAVAESIRDGTIGELEARTNPFRHALTRCLDGSADSEMDLFPQEGGWVDAAPSSIVVLCSDGLTGSAGKALVYESEIYDAFLQTDSIQTASDGLVALAHERGSSDNISVVAAEQGYLPRVPGEVHLPARPQKPTTADGRDWGPPRPSVPTWALGIAMGLGVLLIGLMAVLAWQLQSGPLPPSARYGSERSSAVADTTVRDRVSPRSPALRGQTSDSSASERGDQVRSHSQLDSPLDAAEAASSFDDPPGTERQPSPDRATGPETVFPIRARSLQSAPFMTLSLAGIDSLTRAASIDSMQKVQPDASDGFERDSGGDAPQDDSSAARPQQ